MASIRTSDGVRLDYVDQGSGRPVVLVAGYLAPLQSWLFQQRALFEAGFRVLALDRRSHGSSEDPAFGLRMSRHGKDLHDFLEALDLEGVLMVGGSQGASAIWAQVDLFGTDRLAGIVTVDQTPKMLNSLDWPYGFYGLTAENLGTYFVSGVPATGHGRWIGPPPERAAELAAQMLPPVTPDKVNRLYPLLVDHALQDWRDVVARIDVPALFVAGRDSGFWPCEHAAAAASTNSLASSVVIEYAGHATNLDQIDPFNAELLTFAGGL